MIWAASRCARNPGPSGRSLLTSRSGHGRRNPSHVRLHRVKITGVHEPVYYGPDAASALRGMLSLQMTKALLAPLDAASAGHALSQLRAALANHHSSGGVFFDSYAWLITARRP